MCYKCGGSCALCGEAAVLAVRWDGFITYACDEHAGEVTTKAARAMRAADWMAERAHMN